MDSIFGARQAGATFFCPFFFVLEEEKQKMKKKEKKKEEEKKKKEEEEERRRKRRKTKSYIYKLPINRTVAADVSSSSSSSK